MYVYCRFNQDRERAEINRTFRSLLTCPYRIAYVRINRARYETGESRVVLYGTPYRSPPREEKAIRPAKYKSRQNG